MTDNERRGYRQQLMSGWQGARIGLETKLIGSSNPSFWPIDGDDKIPPIPL